MKMFVNLLFLGTNPFFEAYQHSDLLGKLIIITLIFLSICTWIVLLYKVWITYKARSNSKVFNTFFQQHKSEPLNIKFSSLSENQHNPFYSLYAVLKKHSLEILNKNYLFESNLQGRKEEENETFLSASDIEFIDAQLFSSIASHRQHLEKNLFILSTIVSLGPFLGLLGTVWGILTTFSELQAATGATNQMIIGGLSLALATTVLGLIDAIPALIGYNYLKNAILDFEVEMEGFSNEILSAIEIQYRKVEVK
jgi:biopolymer transport protein TolQ